MILLPKETPLPLSNDSKPLIYKQDSKQTLPGSINSEMGREENASVGPGEALPSISRVNAVNKDASSSPSNEVISASIPNESKITLSGTISPEAIFRIRSLEGCTPFVPLYMAASCYACGKQEEGMWKQVARGFSIFQLCDNCFREWSKHFLNDSYG
jgi:ribosomal protein S14